MLHHSGLDALSLDDNPIDDATSLGTLDSLSFLDLSGTLISELPNWHAAATVAATCSPNAPRSARAPWKTKSQTLRHVECQRHGDGAKLLRMPAAASSLSLDRARDARPQP